jgi:hypothetical protein
MKSFGTEIVCQKSLFLQKNMKASWPRRKKHLLLVILAFFSCNALQHLAETINQSIFASPTGSEVATEKKCFSPNPFMTLLHTGNRTNWIENKRIILTFTLTYMILRSSLQRYEYCRFLRGKQKYCKLEPFILHFSIKLFQWLKDLAKTEKEYP